MCLIIATSFLPFMQPKNEWTGYGSMGSHFYKNNIYEMNYGDTSTGVGKPQIYVLTPYDKIPMIEVSDQRSEINWLRIYPNLPESIRIHGDTLISTYEDGKIIKKVKPEEDGIRISYTIDRKANLTITLWRWYYDVVENITKYNLVNSKLAPLNVLHYTFLHNNKTWACKIVFDPTPDEIVIYGDEVGINKISISFINTKMVSLFIKIVKKPLGNNLSWQSSLIIYPCISTLLSGIYFATSLFPLKLKVKHFSGNASNRSKYTFKPLYIMLLALSVRIALAPFFMHVWDVTTIQEALSNFLSWKNVYALVVEKTFLLRQANGVEANYEGFAYLPLPILIYLPFYLLYVSTFGNSPAIIGGHYEAPLQLVTPNIYFFLILTKLPIIFADAAIVYILTKRSPKIGLLYALMPYSIMITSIWGNFDSIVGLFLLIAFLTRVERPFISGVFYGFSLMKIFMVIVFPAFLLSLPKRRDFYLKFLLGLFLAQIPTILFLIQDPNSMLNVLLFHSVRSPGGVNIYNLAPMLYSYQLQSILNKISMVILSITLVVILIKCKSRMDGIVLSLAAYMAIGPVVNEQHLASLLPILLFLNYDGLAMILSIGYLVYGFLYSGPTYFTAPLAKILEGNKIISYLDYSWKSLFNQITPYLLYTIAIVCSLSVLFTIKNQLMKIEAKA